MISKRNRTIGMLILVIVVVIFFSLLIKRCSTKKESSHLLKVSTQIVGKQDISQKFKIPSELEALYEIQVQSKLSAKILTLALDDGTVVSENCFLQKGQKFGMLEHEDLLNRLKESQANLEIAKASLQMLHIQFEEKERDKKRMENLFMKGAVTEKQKEKAEDDSKSILLQLEQKKAEVTRSQVQVELAQLQVNEALLISPIDGVVATKYLHVGDRVFPNSPIVMISHLDELKMIIGIPQHLIPKIEERQMNLSIVVDAYPDRAFPVEYFEIYPTLDKKTKLAKLELRLKNPFKMIDQKRLYLLKPGMFACAILELKQREQIVAIPTNSILSIRGKHFIFIENEGKAQRKEVVIGIQDNYNTEILEGINEGEKLIVEGHHKLVDGVIVEGETL